MVFNIFTELHNHQHYLEHSHYSKMNPLSQLAVTPYFTCIPPNPRHPLICLLSLDMLIVNILYKDSYNMWPSVTDFFHLACF